MKIPAEVVVRLLREKLHQSIAHDDVNVAHRLDAKKNQNTNRPVIVKLHSMQRKSENRNGCIQIRPNIHVNESLILKRRSLFKNDL